ncbi:hypothetical protein ACFE04_019531 [Oxalis oulophora]
MADTGCEQRRPTPEPSMQYDVFSVISRNNVIYKLLVEEKVSHHQQLNRSVARDYPRSRVGVKLTRTHSIYNPYAKYLQILGKYQKKPPLPFIPGSGYSCTIELERFLGAAGGVGLILARFLGAIARGAEKVQFLRSLGVDHVVDLGSEDVIQSVKEFLKFRKLKGVDVLYDPVGGKLTKDSKKLLNWGANILVIDFASGEVPLIPANIAPVKANLAFSAIRDRKIIGKLMIANLAFSAIRDRKIIGKLMIVIDDKRSTRSKL